MLSFPAFFGDVPVHVQVLPCTIRPDGLCINVARCDLLCSRGSTASASSADFTAHHRQMSSIQFSPNSPQRQRLYVGNIFPRLHVIFTRLPHLTALTLPGPAARAISDPSTEHRTLVTAIEFQESGSSLKDDRYDCKPLRRASSSFEGIVLEQGVWNFCSRPVVQRHEGFPSVHF